MSAQGTFGLTVLAAVYGAVSPWIVGFDATTRLAVNNLVVGLCVAFLACAMAAALDRMHGLAWTLPAFGVWFIVSPWIVMGGSPSAEMIWSNVITGALLTILGLNAAYFGMRARGEAARHT